MTDKASLRRELRTRRVSFVPDGPILVAFRFVALLRRGLVVASYMPVGGEADPAPLARAALAHGCRLALPHVVDRATPITFLAYNEEMALETGPFGLRQLSYDPLSELAPDIVLTPLVGFDRQGNRLGQGAGHYDRAFAAYPDAHRIGVAWSVQEVDALPADPWDVPLHAVATEKEWIA